MKKYILIAIFIAGGIKSIFAQVGLPNNVANANAVLDLNNTNGTAKKGLLLPRVALTSTSAAAPLSAHTAGMHVYNTATAGTNAVKVTPGEYYNDGTKWVRVSSVAWSTNGNAGTNANIHGVGTTDNTDFAMRVNNTERMRVTAAGNVLIGAATLPTGGTNTKLSVSSTQAGTMVIKDGTEGAGNVLMSDSNGVGRWFNTGSLSQTYYNTVAQTIAGAGVGNGGQGPPTTLQTSSPITISSKGTYIATLRWWGSTDGPNAGSKNVSAYIALRKNGNKVDEIEYYYTTINGSYYSFDVTLLAPDCVVGDVLSITISPSVGDMTKARNWYTGKAGTTNPMYMPSILVSKL